ncbi:MAG: acyl-CoA dehydrogenase family protein [Gammaproteobacteria bacterium]|nr:acyl-CoA dehydrogenase family protein [Gammaproteobacteria bacterium]
MSAVTSNSGFDAASIAPVRYGTPELTALIAAIAESAAASKARGENPFAAIDLVRASRLGALRVPVAEGGGGCSVREFFDMLLALAAADSDVAQILRAHFWFTEERMRAHDPAVRKRWIDRVLGGEIFGNAMVEIGTADAVGKFVTRTRLEPAGDHYRLNGTKYYCTGSLFSDWVWVLASTADGELLSVVVPVDRAGVTLEDDWDGVGQRFTGSGTGRFDDVVVHEEEILRSPLDAEVAGGAEPARRLSEPYLVGQFVQLILTTVIAGNLRAAANEAIRLVRTRKRTFTHASAEQASDDPQLQELVGRISAHSQAAEALVLAAADAHQAALDSIENGRAEFDLAHEASLRAAQAKVFVDEAAPRAASQLFELGGASTTLRTLELDRYWRNIVTIAAHNPTAFKARAIGDWLVNGTELPMNGFF